jgi:hypothetical protein
VLDPARLDPARLESADIVLDRPDSANVVLARERLGTRVMQEMFGAARAGGVPGINAVRLEWADIASGPARPSDDSDHRVARAVCGEG